MKLALIIREESYELTLGPETKAEQHTLQLIHDAGISTRGDISIKASANAAGEPPNRLWITIRNRLQDQKT